MGESMRCPHCGATGATRVESVCEYLPRPGGPGRGRLVRQTDHYECDRCHQQWDEESYPLPARRVPVAV